jgi:hypothetical protein
MCTRQQWMITERRMAGHLRLQRSITSALSLFDSIGYGKLTAGQSTGRVTNRLDPFCGCDRPKAWCHCVAVDGWATE